MGRKLNISFLYFFRLSLAALFALGYFLPAIANPQGGVVGAGDATITTVGKTLDVNQTSGKVVIDWRSFDIAPDEITQFIQPSKSSIALNRVNSSSSSQIFGTLTANGNIVIINQNGVLFGGGSHVDVNGLVATTANISNQNFMNGNMKFDQPGNPNAVIQNDGSITAGQAGLVGLVAPNVINNGVITANLGRVQLSSGDTATVDFYGDHLMEVAVGDDVKSQLVSNTGTIQAAGGKIALTAAAGSKLVNSLINVKGELKAPAVSQRNGEIIISATGSNGTAKSGRSKVVVQAKLDASGKHAGQKGGAVSITGDDLDIKNGTVINASGSAGGGTIKIGGDMHGLGSVAHADTTTVEDEAEFINDGIDSGNGGKTVVWSDDQTIFNALISAQGGALGGNGGNVEISSLGKLVLGDRAFVNTLAPKGKAGKLLLDPRNITIATGGSGNGSEGDAVDTTISPTFITTALATSDLTLVANNDITVNSIIDASGNNSGTTLEMDAGRSIILNANLTLGMHNLNLVYNDSVPSPANRSAGAAVITSTGSNITSSGSIYFFDYGFGTGGTNNFGSISAHNLDFDTSHGDTLHGNITTSGGHAIFGIAILGTDIIIDTNGGDINFSGVGGNHNLTINNAGNVYLGISGDNSVGLQPLNNVYVASQSWDVDTLIANGNIEFTGPGQIHTSSVNSLHGNIIFDSTLDTVPNYLAVGGLSANADNGYIKFNDLVGGSIPLGIFAQASNIYLNADINTIGGSEFNGPVHTAGIGVNNYTSGDIRFDSTIDGSGIGIYNSAGDIYLSGDVSNIWSLQASNSFTLSAGTIYLGGNLTTSSLEIFNPVVISKDVTINCTGCTNVWFDDKVNGTTSGGERLTINADNGADIALGSVGLTTSLKSLAITGAGSLELFGDTHTTMASSYNGNNFTAAGNGLVEFPNAVNLTRDFNLTTYDNVTFDNAINGNYGVSVDTYGGNLTFNTIGNITPISGLSANFEGGNSTGTTYIGGNITANYGMEFDGNVFLNNNSVITAINNDIYFDHAIDGARNLTLNANGTGGYVGFGGDIGRNNPLANLTINSSQLFLPTYIDATNAAYNGNTFTANGSGIIEFTGPVNLTRDFSINSGGEIDFDSIIDGNYNFVANSGGFLSFGGNIGSTTPLASLNAYSTNISLGGDVAATNNIEFLAPVVLTHDSTIVSTSGDINFYGTTDGDYNLQTGALNNHNTYFQANVGSNTPLASFIDVDSTIHLGGNFTVENNANFNQTVLDSNSNITSNNGSVYIHGVDGNYNLSINTSTGGISILVDSGTNTALNSFSATSGGEIVLNSISAASIFARTTGTNSDIVINSGSTLHSGASGITLVAKRNFINNEGSDAFDVSGGGRWLVYSTNPTGNTLGSLASDFNRYSCAYGGSCPDFSSETGKGLLYSFTPVLTATPNTTHITYGDAATLTGYAYGLSGYLGSDSGLDIISGVLNGSTTYAQGNNAGIYNINRASGNLASALGYGFTYVNSSTALAVDKKLLTVTATAGQSKTYGAADPGSYAYTYSGLVNGDVSETFSGALSRAAGSNAGTYAIGQNNLAGTGNYSIGTYNGANFTINPALLTVTATAGQSKTYGAADPGSYAYTYSGLVNGDVSETFSGALSRAAGSNAGTYAIGQNNLAGTGNYSIGTYNGANFTINPALLTVTATAGQSKTYGAADPGSYAYTYSGLVNGDVSETFSGALSRAAGSNAGTYAIGQNNLAGTGNYSIGTYNGANFTINPALLTVTATAGQSKTYGAADPGSYAYTYSGLVNGDVSETFSGALSRAAGSNAGTYAIGQNNLAGTGNYSIGTYNGANFTINPALLTVTATAGQSKTYGAADPGSYAYTYSGLVNGDVSETFSGALSRAAGSNAGTYAIGQNNLAGTGNYSIGTYNGANFTINPALLTVTATAGQSKTYGAADPGSYAYTYSGLVNGDVSETFSGALSRAAGSNAGTYAIGQNNLAGTGNYSIGTYNGANFTINPALLTVTATAGQSKTYGAADPGSYAYTYSGLVNGDVSETFSGALSRAAGSNAGTYAIGQNNLAGTGNYSIGTYNGANFTINPALLTVTATAGQSKTYGAADPGSYAYTYSGLVNGDVSETFSGALSRAAGSNAGTYAIGQNNLAGTGNYSIGTYNGANFTINPALLTVTATAGQSKTYGAADPGSYAYTYSGLVNGDVSETFSGALSRAAGSNAGTYAIGQNNLAGTGNYSIGTYNGANFTINPALLTVTATAGQSKTYGAADPGSYAYTYSGLVNGDVSETFSGALSRAAGSNAGTYAIGQNNLAGTGNYSIGTYNGANFTINPALLTVTATAGQSKTYGAADPGSYAYTYSGLVNGDVSETFSGALSRAAGSNAGTYAIGQNNLAGTGNYSIGTYNGANFTINPALLTVTATAGQSKTYGAADPGSYAYTYSGLVNGDVSETFSGALSRAAGSNAGTYAIGQNNLAGTGNYSIGTYNGANFTINPALLTVTATAGQSKTYGAADPGSYAYTYSGLVNGDVSETFSGALSRAAGSNAGTYAIGQNNLAGTGNYSIGTYNGANFTINPALLTVTATAGQSKTYGAADPGSYAYTYSGLVNGDVSETFSGALSRAAGSNAGTYAIGQNNLAGTGNYSIGTYNGANFTINPALLTVTATAGQSKTYGAADPGSYAYTYSGLVNGDVSETFSGALSRAAGSNAGTYAIGQNNLAGTGNYSIGTYNGANFTINPALLTVTATAGQSKTYGAADPGSYAYTYSGLVNGDVSETFSGALSRAAGSNAGTYAIGQNNLAGTGNYSIGTYNGANFTINPALLTVTATAGQSKTYGAADPGSYAYTYSGLVNGDVSETFSGALSRAAGSNAGTYAIGQNNLAGTGNYSIGTYNGANFTINPALLTVTATAGQSKTYGAADPGSYAYTYSGLVNGDVSETFSGALSRAAGSNAGTYAIGQNNLAGTGNYSIGTYNGANFTINPALLTVTATAGQSKTYGAADPGSYAYTYSGLVNGDVSETFSGALSRAAGSNAGTYAIGQNNLAGTGNYSIGTYNGANFTINPALLTVTATAGQSKTYGAADPGSYAYTYSGLVNGDVSETFSGALSRAAGSNAGTYAIGQNNLAGTGNYSIGTYNGANFTINPALLTVTATAGQSKTYGAADPGSYAYTYSGLVNGDVSETFSGALSRAAGSNAGTYAIGQNNLAGTGNYSIGTYNGANFTINPALLTVTATAGQSKTYGAADPGSYAYTYSGLVNGDVSETFSGALSRAAGSNAGTYAIGQNNLAGTGNYSIGTYNGANFTINPALLTVTATAGQSKTYGAADPGSYAYTYSGLVNGDVSETFSGALSRAAGSNAGTYAIGQNNLAGTGNYSIGTYNGANFTINPALLTVTPDNFTLALGNNIPYLTGVISGFKYGQDSSVLTAQPGYATPALNTSPAGNYNVTASGAAAANYIFNYLTGHITINSAGGSPPPPPQIVIPSTVTQIFRTPVINTTSASPFSTVNQVSPQLVNIENDNNPQFSSEDSGTYSSTSTTWFNNNLSPNSGGIGDIFDIYLEDDNLNHQQSFLKRKKHSNQFLEVDKDFANKIEFDANNLQD